MPCRTGYEDMSLEEIDRIEANRKAHFERYQHDPQYKNEWDASIKTNHALFEEKERNRQEEQQRKEAERIQEAIASGYLEQLAFHSFMTVFLCKAMKLIESNNLMAFTFHEMEWWYREHQRRDQGLSPVLTPEELTIRLLKINDYHKVD